MVPKINLGVPESENGRVARRRRRTLVRVSP
jgi:hypothetical protein